MAYSVPPGKQQSRPWAQKSGQEERRFYSEARVKMLPPHFGLQVPFQKQQWEPQFQGICLGSRNRQAPLWLQCPPIPRLNPAYAELPAFLQRIAQRDFKQYGFVFHN
jgi:hypothetical protein